MEECYLKLAFVVLLISYTTANLSYIQYFQKEIRNVVLDSTNLYIGSVNSLWKLDYNLTLLIDEKTGPYLDYPNFCKQPAEYGKYPKDSCLSDTFLKNTSDYNQILFTSDGLSKKGLLLSCGTLYIGGCQYRSLDTLKVNIKYKNSVGPNLHNATVVVVSSQDGRSLYVARTMTYYNEVFKKMKYMVAERNLLNDDGSPGNLDSQDQRYIRANAKYFKDEGTEAPNLNPKESFYPIYYTGAYLFSKSLILTSIQQRNASKDESWVSKIIRISPGEDGHKMKRYIETILSCKKENITYNLLISTSVVEITKSHTEFPGYKKGDKILFGVFAYSTSNTYLQYPHSYEKYAICRFSLRALDQKFNDVQSKCVTEKTRPAPWVDSKSCEEVGSYGQTVSYAPEDPIIIEAMHAEDKIKFQSIHTHEHEKGISVLVSSNKHSLHKFALVNETGVEKLYLYGKKEFADDGKDQSMFFKTEMDATQSTLFLISKHHIARVPYIDCGSRRSCVDCVRGPSCGWCSLMNRCSLKAGCPNNAKPLYFVERDVKACPTSTIKKSVFSVGEYAEITLRTTNVPDGSLMYQCQIGTARIALTRTGSEFNCDSFDFNDISTLNDTRGDEVVKVSVVTKIEGKFYPVVSSTITIFRCLSYKTCDKCITGKYQCGWCTNQMACTTKPGTCSRSKYILYKGHNLNESSQICPKLISTPNTHLPAGMEREVILNGVRFPQPLDGKSYQCILKVGGVQHTTKADWRNSTQLLCKKKAYSFPNKEGRDSMKGVFTVKYGDKNGGGIIDTSTIEVLVYNCLEKTYCSQCLKAVEWNCGWCGAPQKCRFKESCNKWSPAASRCPSPVVNEFFPMKASIKAKTELVIKGDDLGSSGDVKSVTVAGHTCTAIIAKHIEFQQITCVLPAVEEEQHGYINVSLILNGEPSFATSKKKFSFVKPEVKDIEPKSGPCSGGTNITVIGRHLDAGRNFDVKVGNLTCQLLGERNPQKVTCKTKSATNVGNVVACSKRKRRAVTSSSPLNVCVYFEGSHKVCSAGGFQYKEDPLINTVYTNKGIIRVSTFFSGGQVINVEGLRLKLIQHPKIQFKTLASDEKTETKFQSSCQFATCEGGPSCLHCLAPNISSAFSGTETNATVWLGFNLADLMLEEYKKILVVSNPVFYPFHPDKVLKHEFKTPDLKIRGTGFSVLDRKDVKVTIAGVPCTGLGLRGNDGLICTMPEKKELDKKALKKGIYDVKVIVGDGGLEYDIGVIKYIKYDYTLYLSLAAAAGVVIIFIVIISVCVLYRRRHLRDKKDYHNDLQLHMDKIESQYARECKEAFAEYTTERSDLTSDVEQEIPPRREFRQFAMRVLYPGLESHPILENNKDDRTAWEKSMKSFIELLKDKEFTLTFVRTLEYQSTFQMTDRCIVASLLMVALQDDIVLVTEILKELLKDLINKAGNGKRPKLLLRRTESIAEKLLTNWLAYTLFDFLSDVVGDPLFQLFTAFNILLDKEPADAITFDAKNSLSEDKLLRSKVDFKSILINVEYVHPKFGGIKEGISVLSTDTITQVKEKIIKHIYKNQPHSLRPLPDDLQLGHIGPNGAPRYMQDCDASNVVEGEWKKLNTLGYVLNLHKIPECACLRLSHCAETLSANGSVMMDDSFPNVTFHSSISSTPMLYDCGTEPKLYHLVKPSEYVRVDDDVRQSKMMAEVYLTRLLKIKETLLSFVNQLFEAIFGMSNSDRVIPPSIKFLFDFLDGQAEKIGIEDTDVHHTWKNNSLPLRFWINIIKNPDFVFDIRKSNTADSCLSVIAQLFMDSCSPDEHRLGKDSPSNKLLYAKEIPGYKKEVKRFYKDVKEAMFDEKEFYRKLDNISSLYGNSFNSLNAAYELMSYAVLYKVKLMDNLEEDNSVEDAEKLQEIMENIPDD